MRIVIFFAPAFLSTGKAFMKALQERDPETEIIGIAATGKIYRALKKDKTCRFKLLECLETLERGWLSRPRDPAEMKSFIDEYGAKMIGDILTLDRQVGQGFITGARLMETELSERARDHEAMRSYVSNMLRYFIDLYDAEKPDAVFLYVIASAPLGAAAWLAQARNIPVPNLVHARVEDRQIVDTSIRGDLEPVWARFFRNEQAKLSYRKQAAAWLEEFRAFDKKPDYVAFSSGQIKGMFRPAGLLKNFITAFARFLFYAAYPRKRQLRADSGLYLLKNSILLPLRAAAASRKTNFCDYEELKRREFIYYALHVDPEASTMHFAPDYTDQLAVLEALAKRRPLHMNILVKEHAPMLGKRPPGFYERIKRLPGVYLVHPGVSSRDMIMRSALVFTITGTVAWEAIALRKPAAIMGSFPFAPFATKIGKGVVMATFENLAYDIEDAIRLPPVSDEELLRFLGLLFEESFPFPAALLWGRVTDQTVRRHAETIEAMAEQFFERCANYSIYREAA